MRICLPILHARSSRGAAKAFFGCNAPEGRAQALAARRSASLRGAGRQVACRFSLLRCAAFRYDPFCPRPNISVSFVRDSAGADHPCDDSKQLRLP
jgi:hypothetical protein